MEELDKRISEIVRSTVKEFRITCVKERSFTGKTLPKRIREKFGLKEEDIV
ncbi:MAG: hypothetical protein M1454_04660 [Candidatus Thermoplasmatota archaeon]|nr:hypothetical protein [Candidatus Thermoplasmatota archaeon]MCL5731176.1 hypothetical protein [Candidatus Thermoplasmatota archaeon]